MLKLGDWITMQNRDVDGIVTDITLNTVKVQNFDKTIITIPTYSLVSESFQSWTGMEESGVRQIKRSILIDMKSIRFLDFDLKERLSKIPSISEYIDETESKGKTLNDDFFNVHRLTNLGVFRYYFEQFLRKHPLIDKNNTIMVRHREPRGNGLPLQVYAFALNNSIIPYEHIQSGIIEHLLAILKEFDLKVYQMPTIDDLPDLSARAGIK